MAVRLVTYAEDPELVRRFSNEGIWPEFLHHDAVVRRYWDLLYSDYPAFQFVLHDAGDDRLVGLGSCVPTVWDGHEGTLGRGVDDVLEERFAGDEAADPDVLCALVAIVPLSARGAGWSSEVLGGMRSLARRHGLRELIAPVRPTLKPAYPLVPIERYASWRRDDGLPFDPWMRVHHRLGARVAGIAPRSLVVEGTVADWEGWTGMAFPEPGEYVVPGALVPVVVDRERDLATYVEPNVWMVHPLS